MQNSDYTPEETKKISQTLERLKGMYKEQPQESKEEIYRVFAEILEDPYYKENLGYYFRRFLTENY